jgi:hypothetical protein
MKDTWKASKWVLRGGHTLRIGTRRTAACAAREELDADIPEHWHIAKVVNKSGTMVGFGLSRKLDSAKLYALFTAGLLTAVAVSGRAAAMQVTNTPWRA